MDDGEKKNPLNALILAEDANQGAGGIAALPTRVGRYGEAHRRALAMADYALSLGEKAMASKLTLCGDFLLFRHFFTVDDVRLHAANLQRQCGAPALMPALNHPMVQAVSVERVAGLLDQAQAVNHERCTIALLLDHFHKRRCKNRLAATRRGADQDAAGAIAHSVTGLVEGRLLVIAQSDLHVRPPSCTDE